MKVFFAGFGCKVNQYETESIKADFISEGFSRKYTGSRYCYRYKGTWKYSFSCKGIHKKQKSDSKYRKILCKR